jgi:predicted  nucleic acid-binding Zn-ribbon protein
MNPLLFPPTLIKRALDDLSAIADAARRLPTLEEQVLDRIERIERHALARADALTEELRALRAAMAPIQQIPALREDMAPIRELTKVREGIEPLDDDMRAVRNSVDDLEPLIRDVNAQLEQLRADLGPLGELADKIPGIGR